MGQFSRKIVTIILAPGDPPFNLPDGVQSVDIMNNGTSAGQAATLTGQTNWNIVSQPVEIPFDKPYTLEFNAAGYASTDIVPAIGGTAPGFIAIENPAGNDGNVNIVLKS